ncbi:MAG: PD-(D/E)XK nuclease family protein [Nitrospirota bacterium]
MTPNLHILPFGPPAWKRRKEIIAGIIASRRPEAGLPAPPWDFRDMLYLVPNERMVKSVRALFIDALFEATGASGCIPPGVMALNRFIQSRIDAAKTISPLARKLLLEEICQGLAGKVPGLEDEALARSLSGPVSEALERTYLHNAGERLDNASDNPALFALARAKKEYERRLSELGLFDRARLLSLWEPKPEGFPEYRLVILDGFYDALPHELRLMKALSSGRTLYFIIEAPGLSGECGLSAGQKETGGAPDGAAPSGLGGEGMPYAGTKRLINELFPGVEIRPDYPYADEDAQLLAGAVFLGRPLTETVKLLKAKGQHKVNRRIVSALTLEDEVAFIARTIKERALAGNLRLDKTLVLFPEPTRYQHAFRKIFDDYGIPYSFQETRPLIGEPFTQVFLDLLSIPAQDYPFRLMRRAFYSPLIRLGAAGNRALEFDRYSRDEGITGGRRRWELLARGAKLAFTAELNALLDLLKTLDARELHPAKWAELASGLLGQSGMADKGLQSPEPLPHIEQLKGTVDELRAALKNLTSRVTLGRFIGIVKGALSEVQALRKVDAFSGVRVLGRLEAFSEGFDTVFIAGLNSGSLPSTMRRDLFFLDEKGAGSASLDTKTRDSRVFMGLILGAREVYLSYPKESGGKPTTPSPWIMALKPFVIAGVAEEINDYCRPSGLQDALGEEEFIRALSMNGYGSAAAPAPVHPISPVIQKRRFSVTELEDYIKCPYRYYHRWVLKDQPPEEPSDDAAPDASGRAVHGILAKFYTGRNEPVRRDEVGAAYRELTKLADEEFSALADTLANREAKRKFLEKIAPKVLAVDAELPPGTVIKDVEKKVEGELPVSDTETVTVVGKIDRLEYCGGEGESDGSYLIVDYKTGRYPGNGAPLKNGFQLPLYAFLLRKYLPEKRPSAFVYYNLGKTGETRDVVCYDTTLHSGRAVNSKERKRDGGEEMDEYIDSTAGKASEAARGIIAGEFPQAKDKDECRYCEVADACPGAEEEEGE